MLSGMLASTALTVRDTHATSAHMAGCNTAATRALGHHAIFTRAQTLQQICFAPPATFCCAC